ncbi:UvrD-helicase domain-containing protein [Candidatus Uhrbacteria bacterium]|nr:UvrD-helicase domain-containing protein [Candidatus Uhrbacteria bacterium]
MPEQPDRLLEGLNDAQRAAVTHGEGPLMIVAGAGTGKTKAITHRIAWLIETGKAKQDEILALTFTDKAANEMEERVDRLLPIGYLELWISTFHGFCERVLRAHGLDIGLPNTFTLVTDVDAWLLVRRNLDRFNLDYYTPRGTPTKFIEAMLQHFSRAKDECVTPEMYLARAAELDEDASGGDPNVLAALTDDEKALERKKWRELADAYRTYQQLLTENGALDFGDLIAYTLELFRTRPNVLKKFQEQFRFIVVDEFQDTNRAQYELVKLLAGTRRNVTVVGDDDQAIYRFRGAALANILNFRTDFPDATRVVLTHNYRSGKAILDRSYALIQHNNPHRLEASEALDKRLVAANGTDGFVHHVHAATLTDEVRQTAETILALHGQGCPWAEVAILVRANDAAEPFILELERAGIPYRFVALSGLYTKPVILDALAYLRVIDQPHDGPSMYRVLSHPTLGMSEADVVELTLHGKKRGLTLHRALESATMLPRVSMEGKRRALELLQELETLRRTAKRLPVTELFVEVVKQTGILGAIATRPEREQREQYGYLQSFLERLRRFAQTAPDRSLHAFLEEFAHERAAGEAGSLPQDAEEGPDVVSIMTVHAAKGLEFRYVFVVNLVEQRFPSQSRGAALAFPPGLMRDEEWSSEEHHREERRLFYVAMTRAKDGLYLMSAKDYGGARYKKPSRFLVELGFVDPSQIVTKKERAAFETQDASPDTRPIDVGVPDKLSFTQITAFAKCPLQYKFAHVLHVPVFGRYQMSFGKSMHNALQRFMEHLLPQEAAPQASLFDAPALAPTVPGVNDLLTMFQECWIDEWYESEEQKEEYRKEGRESLRAFHARTLTEQPKPLYLEKGFTLKVAGVCVKGRIDRIDACDDGVEIVDYKTGKPKTSKDIGWDEKRQLVLYAMAVEQCFPDAPPVKKVTYYYLGEICEHSAV